MNKFVLRQSLLLLLTATIWGVAFVAQSVSMDYVGPFTFNAVRCLIGGVVLLPCIAILNIHDCLMKIRMAHITSVDKEILMGSFLTGSLRFGYVSGDFHHGSVHVYIQ